MKPATYKWYIWEHLGLQTVMAMFIHILLPLKTYSLTDFDLFNYMPGLILSQWVMLKGYSINANMQGLGNNPENFFELVCLAIPLFFSFFWYLFISLICFGDLLSNWSYVLYFSSLYTQSILLFSFHHHYGTDGKDLRTKKHNFKFQTLLTVLWAAR